MNASALKATFELAARQLGLSPSFIEKDWHVTQVLKTLASIQSSEFELIFSGGTALSKAHQLTQRFSEDIDFIITAHATNQNRQTRSKIKHKIIKTLNSNGFPIKDQNVQAKNENQFFAIDLEYTTHFNQSRALRPHVQIEMTFKATQLEPVMLPVSSLIATLSNSQPEVENITCIDAVENAADKLSAITWRIPDQLQGNEQEDPSLVRHIYDLSLLRPSAKKRADTFKKLVLTCMKKDIARAKNNAKFTGSTVNEK